MRTISTISDLRKLLCVDKKNLSLGFVPTMGFLHEGHLSLVRRSKKENGLTVVSIYVNPLQFGPTEDFKKYPRDLERDRKLLAQEGVDVLFVPTDEEMFGEGTMCKDQTIISPPECLTNCLCGKSRPGHFEGVATIVVKLFEIVSPNRAYFGQKDYQQCLVIQKLVRDLHFPIDIVMCPTARAKDGLAMSSRNIYLSKQERKVAQILYKSLQYGKDEVLKGKISLAQIAAKSRMFLEKIAQIKVDYFEIRDAADLRTIKKIGVGSKVLIAGAVWIGKTRIIDNMLVRIRGC